MQERASSSTIPVLVLFVWYDEILCLSPLYNSSISSQTPDIVVHTPLKDLRIYSTTLFYVKLIRLTFSYIRRRPGSTSASVQLHSKVRGELTERWAIHSAAATAAARTTHISSAARTLISVRWVHGRRIDALLLLPPIAEPHSHHFLLHAQLIGQVRDLLTGWLRVDQERLLQSYPHRRLDWGALLPPPAHRLRRRQRVAHGARTE